MIDPSLLVVLPLVTAFLLPVIDRASGFAGRWIGPLVLTVTLLIGLSLWHAVGDGAVSVPMGGFPPPLGIALYIDRLALLFAIAMPLGALLLWPRSYGEGVAHPVLTLLLVAAGSGLALSGDLFNIYVFYELTAVISYGLIAGRATSGSQAAALRYLIVSSFGAALALIGVALIYQATGTLNLAHLAELAPSTLNNSRGLVAFALLLIGFGVKAELFPVNIWVPEVYATAQNRVCGLLAGVVSKLAALIILRLLVLVFRQPAALDLLLALGVLGVVTGELAAWRARDFNRMLAFSSIGQLGIVFIAFAVPGPGAVLAGLAVALHHLVVKPALFLLAERWSGALEHLDGAAARAPVAAALFVILALSLIGVPPLPGFWAKLLVLIELARQAQPLDYLAAFAVLAGALLEANYLFRVATRFWRQPQSHLLPEPHATPDLATAGLLGGAVIAATLLIAPLGDRLSAVAATAADSGFYVHTVAPRGRP